MQTSTLPSLVVSVSLPTSLTSPLMQLSFSVESATMHGIEVDDHYSADC